jgi:hypothetical protein
MPKQTSIPIAKFRVELSEVLASTGFLPRNFTSSVDVNGPTLLTGKVVMTTKVDKNQQILLSTTDTVVSVPKTVVVPVGQNSATFQIRVEDVTSTTDVLVIAFFRSFIPSPARTLLVRVNPLVIK